MSLPRLDFLIVGAQKCGTSWLHERLRVHPDFFLPVDKDDEYLSFRAHIDDPGRTAGFRARFSGAPEGVLLGDACASYLWTTAPRPEGFNPDLPGTARDLFGAALRVIVLLCDPVKRAVSAYLHHLRHGSLDWNLTLARAPAELGLVELGRYGAQVAAWADSLGAERVGVFPGPADVPPDKVLAGVCAFLGRPAPADPAGETVFPGLERRRDDRGGVWIRPDDPLLSDQPPLRRPVPMERRHGQHWIRIIHPAELRALRVRLAEDSAALARWLDSHGRRREGFETWLPDPAPPALPDGQTNPARE